MGLLFLQLYLALTFIPSVGIAFWQVIWSTLSTLSSPGNYIYRFDDVKFEEDNFDILFEYPDYCPCCQTETEFYANEIFEREMDEYNSRRKLDLFIIAELHFVKDENGGRLRRTKYEKRPFANDTNVDGSFNKIYGYLFNCFAFAIACLPISFQEFIFLGYVALRVYQSMWVFDWIDKYDWTDKRNWIPPCLMIRNDMQLHLMFVSEVSLYRMNRPLFTNVVLMSAWFLSTYMGCGFPFLGQLFLCIFRKGRFSPFDSHSDPLHLVW